MAQDFPSGPVVKNLPGNTEDTGSILGWGTELPHAAGQLSRGAATTGALTPQLERLHVPQGKIHMGQRRFCMMHLRSDTAK